jgi:4a-hydroxytetrahydrobiopterin dehydratase
MPLHDDEIRYALSDLPEWKAIGNALHKEFRFRGFRAAISFLNRVAEQASAAGHHPDIEIHYDRVHLSLSTHSDGGITEKDVALAHAIEGVRDPDTERASTGSGTSG